MRFEKKLTNLDQNLTFAVTLDDTIRILFGEIFGQHQVQTVIHLRQLLQEFEQVFSWNFGIAWDVFRYVISKVLQMDPIMVWDEVDDSFERSDVTVRHVVWEPLEGERGHKGSLVVLVLPNQDIGKKNV